jgi:hypothetical protein
MAVGKRHSTDQPLTEHDVADRLSNAMLRALRILEDSRQLGLMAEVKSSRYYHPELIHYLEKELEAWK